MSAKGSVVCIVDDDLSMREALTNLFRSVGLNVRTFETAQAFLGTTPPEAPACLVLDVRLPDVSGLELQGQLLEADIRIPIIFITGHGDIRMSVRAMKAGAVEFLTKPFRDQEILEAVQQAIELDRKERERREFVHGVRQRYDSLTLREQQVLALVVQGSLNKQIAQELHIAEPTVKLHRGRLVQKMKAGSLAGLIRMAEALGIGL